MSFCADVKKEIADYIEPARHCQIARLCAIMNNAAVVRDSFGEKVLYLYTDNFHLASNFCRLIYGAFGVIVQVRIRTSKKSKKRTYYAVLKDNARVEKVLKAVGSLDNGQQVYNPLVLKQDCCKRSYLKGVFISNASISDPGKNYHLEFVFTDMFNAEIVMRLLENFELKPRLIIRKKNFVAYIKDAERISELLGFLGAHHSLLDFEGLRVFKIVSNDINRQVNCETANMAKTARAFVSCQEDIYLIERLKGLSYLSKPLREAAQLRLDNPGATLKEIGEMMSPPISKSGVNHRLRKISEIAERLRGDFYG